MAIVRLCNQVPHDVPLICLSGPWPHGVCGKCAPPNAVLHLQKYRHCDGISFKNTAAGEKFIAGWNANPGLQQAAILFGRFIDEPTTTGNFGAIRAEVECLYKPPQESLPDGVNLLRDTQEANVLKVVAELGLEPVGWAITTLPRGGKEYGQKQSLSFFRLNLTSLLLHLFSVRR